MEETSREAAVDLLSDILRHREQLIQTDALKNVQVNALFDSELEARFIEALRRARTEDLAVSLTKELVNGKPGYFLGIGDRAYFIEPQVKLGPEEGISIRSKADFVFRSARVQDAVKPIAVFADGFLYHRDRIGRDMAQRMAIAQSGRYHVWSLTWKDVENRFSSQGDYFKNYLDPAMAPGGNNFGQFLKEFDLNGYRTFHQGDSFGWLIRFLLNPDEEPSWQLYAFVQGLINLDARRFATPEAVEEWSKKLAEIVPVEMLDVMQDVECPCLYGLTESEEEGSGASLSLFAEVEQAAVRSRELAGMRLAGFFDDQPEYRTREGFESIWNGYLRLYNLFQLLPHAFFITQEGLSAGAYEGLRLREAVFPGEEAEEVETDVWSDVRDVTNPNLHGLLDRLKGSDWPAPEAGFELVDDKGEIVATAELAWAELKISFLLEEELLYRKAFEEAGWQVFPLSEVLADPDSIISLHQG